MAWPRLCVYYSVSPASSVDVRNIMFISASVTSPSLTPTMSIANTVMSNQPYVLTNPSFAGAGDDGKHDLSLKRWGVGLFPLFLLWL